MKIRTKCKNCAYLRTGNKCVNGFSTYSEDDEVYVDAFCRFKRQDPVSTDEIISEDQNIGMVLDCFGKAEEYVIENIKNEIKNYPFVSEWIIAMDCSYSNDTIRKIQEEFIGKDCSWSVRIFVNNEDFDFDDSMVENESIKERKKCNWYSYKKISAAFDKNLYTSFVQALNQQKNFLEIRSNQNFIRNYFAFTELSGNFNGLFTDKIKVYENHEEAVITV